MNGILAVDEGFSPGWIIFFIIIAIVALILIAVIMLRPHGLLGRPEERTV